MVGPPNPNPPNPLDPRRSSMSLLMPPGVQRMRGGLARARPAYDSARMSDRFEDVHARSSVDNLLRTVQQHHVQLSLMADTKASILITNSSIVLTIALSRSNEAHLRPALLTIAATSLIPLLLPITAVLP